MLPDIHHYTPLTPRDGFTERGYVTLYLPAYGGGTVSVTSTMNDGIVDTGDIMVHIGSMAFVANSRDMMVI